MMGVEVDDRHPVDLREAAGASPATQRLLIRQVPPARPRSAWWDPGTAPARIRGAFFAAAIQLKRPIDRGVDGSESGFQRLHGLFTDERLRSQESTPLGSSSRRPSM